MPRIAAANLAEHHELIWSKLLEAFERLLATKPLDEIALAEVASAAGIARTAIYNYAADKPSLLAAVAELAGRSIVDHIGEMARQPLPPAARISAILRYLEASFTSGEHRHVLAQAVFGNLTPDPEKATAIFEIVIREIGAVVAEGVQGGAFRHTIDPPVTVNLMVGTVAAAIHRIAARPDEARRVGEELEAFILGALGFRGAGPAGLPGAAPGVPSAGTLAAG